MNQRLMQAGDKSMNIMGVDKYLDGMCPSFILSFPFPYCYAYLATSRMHLALGQSESEIPIYYHKLEGKTSICPVSCFPFKRKFRTSLEPQPTSEKVVRI